MAQKITNMSGITLTFSEEGVLWDSSVSRTFFPYGSLVDVRIGFMGFEMTTRSGKRTFAFHNQYRPIMEEWLEYAKYCISVDPPAEPVDLTAEKKEEEARIAKAAQNYARRVAAASEHRMRCNVCGHIFCYTDQDLKNNRTNAALSAISSAGTIAAALGGTRYDMYEQNKMAQANAARVQDYSRCPNCRSVSIVEIEQEESAAVPAQPAVNGFEEIKRFKELLDMGIITQEEFDAKKKQLLGL